MLITPAILSSFSSLKDKTLKVVFETNEPTPEMINQIVTSNGQFGYLSFKTEPFKKEEIELLESLKSDFVEFGKSQSQRMRAVLYKNWEQKNEGFGTFEEFYKAKMEYIINHFKSKLD